MIWNLQDIAAAGLVTLAVGYLGLRGWTFLARKRTGGCGGGACSSCPSPTQTAEGQQQQFIPVDQLTGSSQSTSRFSDAHRD